MLSRTAPGLIAGNYGSLNGRIVIVSHSGTTNGNHSAYSVDGGKTWIAGGNLSGNNNYFHCLYCTKQGTVAAISGGGTEIVPQNADNLRSTWLPWEQRNGVIIVAGASKTSRHPASIYDLRIMLADFFFENNFYVAWYGTTSLYGYSRGKRLYYKGPLTDKVNKIREYKFTICTENTYDPVYSHNYLTEKLPHAIYGGALPLYMGCYNIDKLVPKHTFFDLRNFVIRDNGKLTLLKQPLLEAINSFTKENFERYQEAAYQFVKDPLGLSYHADMKRFLRQMLKEYYP
jgi:hypothetical protein